MFSRNSVDWLYRSESAFSWDSGLPIEEDQYFTDSTGIVRLVLHAGGRITVMADYAWNGCSPKIAFCDLLIGTPDGVVYKPTGRPKTYYATMVHDALYQFMGADSPIGKFQADRCFLRLMGESEFLLRYIYWFAVFLLGWFAWHGKRIRRHWKGSRERVAEMTAG